MAQRLITIFLIMAAAIGYSVYQNKSLNEQLVSNNEVILSRLPTAEFETLDGNKFDVYQFMDSQKVKLLVIHYWGTWCAPCEAELPELLSFIKRFADRPEVKFLLVAVNDDKIKIQKHLKTLSFNSSSIVWLMDNENIHRDIYGTTRVPETYVFSSGKTTLRKYVGPQEWNKGVFFQTFDEFIQISSRQL